MLLEPMTPVDLYWTLAALTAATWGWQARQSALQLGSYRFLCELFDLASRSNGDDTKGFFTGLTEARAARLVVVLALIVGLAWPVTLPVMLARR